MFEDKQDNVSILIASVHHLMLEGVVEHYSKSILSAASVRMHPPRPIDCVYREKECDEKIKRMNFFYNLHLYHSIAADRLAFDE